jgi:hypothetical protein
MLLLKSDADGPCCTIRQHHGRLWIGGDRAGQATSEETTNTQRFEEDSWLTSQSMANRSPGRIPC